MVNCTKSPATWRCTRASGHDGPCAAVPDTTFELTGSAWWNLLIVMLFVIPRNKKLVRWSIELVPRRQPNEDL